MEVLATFVTRSVATQVRKAIILQLIQDSALTLTTGVDRTQETKLTSK